MTNFDKWKQEQAGKVLSRTIDSYGVQGWYAIFACKDCPAQYECDNNTNLFCFDIFKKWAETEVVDD